MKFLIYISMTLLMSCQTTSSNESEQINTYNDKGVEIETELEKPVINDRIWVNYEFKDG